MSVMTLPDVGLIRGLRLPSLPRDGYAVDLGFGSARNLFAMARVFSGKTQGYEVDPGFLDRANEIRIRENYLVDLELQDALNLEFDPGCLSIAGIGVAIFMPKSLVYKLFKRVWEALKPFGVLHADFGSPNDDAFISDFFKYTCEPFPEPGYESSYFHSCPAYVCEHKGTSHWNVDQLTQLRRDLGANRLIHYRLREWTQYLGEIGEPNSKPEKMFRSFHRLTIQKLPQ